MAKNKITIDIEVNGKMQKATVSAEKLSEALKKTGKNARTADRNLKGAAQASANGTKNFSKMAQGMTGGLVPAYAAFAAQVFALTAAFNFLRNAADLENLRKSQVSFAQSSGLAIKSVTNELQEASKGMLGFQEAAQAAAIGAAKGFSTSQLTQITEGAAKAAGALGRSFQDTFDRLLRGVSKAEPELLDELGITLRLEEATQRYGDAIGKSRDKLTAAERSQAVFVETMRQLNDTFGDQEVLVNPFIQLSKTFEKISQDLTSKLLPLFIGLADIINKNATAAAIAFGALGAMVLANIAGLGPALKGTLSAIAGGVANTTKSIGSSFAGLAGKVGTGISDAAKKAVYEIEFAELELQEKLEKLGSGDIKGAATKLGGKSKTVEKLALGKEVTPKALGKLKADLSRVKKELKETGEVAKGVFAGATLEAVEELEEEIKKIGKTSLTTGEKIQKFIGEKTIKALDKVRKATTKTARGFRALGEGAKRVGAGISFVTKVAGKLFFIAGIIGIVIAAFEKLAETPITVIDNFKSFLSGLVKGFQTALNLIIKGINALLDNAMIRRIFGDAPQIAEVTFAVGIDKKLDELEGDVLNALGTSREELQVIEDTTSAQKDHEQQVLNVREKYKALKEDIESITAGIVRQTDEFRKTNQIAKGIATLPLAGALTQAAKHGDFEAAFNEVFKDVDVSAFGETFAQAVADRDIAAIENLTTAATSYNSSLAAIKDASGSIRKDLGTGDPLGARVLLEQLINTAKAGDTAVEALGRDGGLLDLLSKNAGTDAEGLLTSLMELEQRAENIKNAKSNLAIRQVRQSRAPGAVGRQQALGFASEAATYAVAEKKVALEQLILANQNLSGKELELHQQEVANRRREIALLEEKADVAETNATEMGQLGMAVGNSLADSMQRAFDGLIQGTMSAKEAFASMAQSMLQAIAKVISELLVAKILTAALGGSGFGDFLGIPAPAAPGGRYGGVMSGGKKAPGYAVGGVAKGPQSGYPAILHGTEAIVPLPNGKSIPVDIRGSGQQNNVVVNVSVDNQGNATQDTQADNNNSQKLGTMIAGAVQKELHNQKRAGGILNPMGVS